MQNTNISGKSCNIKKREEFLFKFLLCHLILLFIFICHMKVATAMEHERDRTGIEYKTSSFGGECDAVQFGHHKDSQIIFAKYPLDLSGAYEGLTFWFEVTSGASPENFEPIFTPPQKLSLNLTEMVRGYEESFDATYPYVEQHYTGTFHFPLLMWDYCSETDDDASSSYYRNETKSYTHELPVEVKLWWYYCSDSGVWILHHDSWIKDTTLEYIYDEEDNLTPTFTLAGESECFDNIYMEYYAQSDDGSLYGDNIEFSDDCSIKYTYYDAREYCEIQGGVYVCNKQDKLEEVLPIPAYLGNGCLSLNVTNKTVNNDLPQYYDYYSYTYDSVNNEEGDWESTKCPDPPMLLCVNPGRDWKVGDNEYHTDDSYFFSRNVIDGTVYDTYIDDQENTVKTLMRGIPMFNVRSSEIPDLEGYIKGRLYSREDIYTEENIMEDLKDNDIHKAYAELYRLKDGYLRSQYDDESDDDYKAFVNSQLESTGIVAKITPNDYGEFSFENIPYDEFATEGRITTYKRIYYTVRITRARSEEVKISSPDYDVLNPNIDEVGTSTIYFYNSDKHNLRASLYEENKEETVHSIYLDRADDIAWKLAIAKDLQKFSKNYSEEETKVLAYLETLLEDTDELTPEKVEGVKRAFWAEKVVLDSAQISKILLKIVIDSLAKIITDFWSDFSIKKDKMLSDQLDRLQNLRNAKALQQNADKIDDIKEAIQKIYKETGGANAMTSEMVSMIRQTFNVLMATIEQHFKDKKAADEDTKKAIDAFSATFRTILETLENISLTGALKTPVSEAIKFGASKAHGEAFDSSLELGYSYCEITDDLLDSSYTYMQAWNSEDDNVYRKDIDKVTDMLSLIYDEHTEVQVMDDYSKEFATAFGTAEDIFGMLSTTGIPWFKYAEKFSQIMEYALTGINGNHAAWTVFITLPDLTDKGVCYAYGKKETCNEETSTANSYSLAAKGETLFSTGLLSDIEASRDSLNLALDQLTGNLNDNNVANALITFSGVSNNSFVSSFDDFNVKVSRLLSQAAAAAGGNNFAENLTYSNIRSVSLIAYYYGLLESSFDLYYKVAMEEYDGFDDPLYLAERNDLLYHLNYFKTSVTVLFAYLEELSNEMGDISAYPAVLVENISVISDITGNDTVTKSPEDFTINARIKNISPSTISDLTAKLNIITSYDISDTGEMVYGESAFIATTPLEAIIGNGYLAPDDRVDNSGEDEANVSWRLQYNGYFSMEDNVVLQIEILEGGETPSTFYTEQESIIMSMDHKLLDKDLDGIPDDYEVLYGMDTARDDSLDDIDGDGLPNKQEYVLETRPDVTDTDYDGLSDREEVTGGTDGYITDPLEADTDGDEVPDNIDGNPIDGGTSEYGEKPEEPVIELDKTEVILTKSESSAMVTVSNSGAGTLVWTALSDNEAVAKTMPSFPSLHSKDGTLFIMTPHDYDFEASGTTQSTVKVIDAGGNTKEYKKITVKVIGQ